MDHNDGKSFHPLNFSFLRRLASG